MVFWSQTCVPAINQTDGRCVFVEELVPVFEHDSSECIELLRLLYGLCRADDLWHESQNQHITQHLHLVPTKTDTSLYFSFRENILVGIHGSYVDDLLHSGDDEFRPWSDKTHEKFETREDDESPINISGFNISGTNNSLFCMDRIFYVKRLEVHDP